MVGALCMSGCGVCIVYEWVWCVHYFMLGWGEEGTIHIMLGWGEEGTIHIMLGCLLDF